MLWRYWLLELPARIAEVAAVWYRVYFTIVICVAAIILPLMTLVILILWFGFGIRWGW